LRKRSCILDRTPEEISDVNYGDLTFRFSDSPACRRYVGIDISPTIIERNRAKLKEGELICQGAVKPTCIETEAVLCLDLPSHILGDTAYNAILENLAGWTEVAYAWENRPPKTDSDDLFQRSKCFSRGVHLLEEEGPELTSVGSKPKVEPRALHIIQRRVSV